VILNLPLRCEQANCKIGAVSELLYIDDPIESMDQDRLGRDRFVHQVGRICDRVAGANSSSVLALVGPWGSGKSSVLSLVQKELVAEDKWLLCDFNPWLFSDLESLLRSFFATLASVLPEGKGSKARKKLAAYAQAVSPLGALVSLVGVDASKILAGLGNLIEGDQSVQKKRQDLEEALRSLEKPILVVMDDLDRLQPDELLLTFKLVRVVARLPGVHYLLTYDERTLLDVLQRTDLARDDERRARDYLEKIVQIRLDLPYISDPQRGKLVDTAFENMLSRSEVTLTADDEYRFAKAYHECLRFYLREPRHINRFFAQAEAMAALVTEEVDFVDFTLLTFLRVFEPKLYKLVYDAKEELTQPLRSNSNADTAERRKRWRERIEKVSSVDHGAQLLDLLANLFMPIRSLQENLLYRSGNLASYHRRRSVGSRQYFDRYFVFGIPVDDISDTDVARAVDQIVRSEPGAERDELERRLVAEPSLILDKIATLDGITPFVEPGPLLKLLASAYDQLPEGSLTSRPEFQAYGLACQLLRRVGDAELEGLLDAMIDVGGLRLLAFASNTGDKPAPPEDKKWIGVAKPLVEARAREALESHADMPLREVPASIITCIRQLAFVETAPFIREWVWGQIDSGKWELKELLGRFVNEGTAFALGARPRKIIGAPEPATIDKIFGLDRLIENLGDQLDAPEIVDPEGLLDFGVEASEREAVMLKEVRKARDRKASGNTGEPDDDE
jgi:hypothetical protein